MPKPTGKINQALYDECIEAFDANLECELCLTYGQIRALFPQVEYLHWSSRWYTETGLTIDTDKIDAFASDLECRLMSCGEQVIIRQLDAETGTTNISYNGGLTWQPDPDDPRNSGIALPPPITAGVSEDECAAANSGLTVFQEYVQSILDQKIAEATYAEMLLALTAFLVGILVAPVWALLPAILSPIMGQIFLYSYSEFNAAMTSAVYQQVLCILKCNMKDDGSFDQAGFGQALGSAGTLPNEIAIRTFVAWMRSLTLLGLNNACAMGKTNSSGLTCESCNCSDNCFFSWLSYIGNSKSTGTDAHGDYVQFDSYNTGVDKRVSISNFGTYPDNNPNVCCYWENGLIHHFRASDDVETNPGNAVGRLCGDGNWQHYTGILPNNFWAVEFVDTLASPDFYIRIYAEPWGV